LSTLARVVFALLVAATFGAFFVSQRLKNAESVAEYTKLRHYFSPNGDGVRDRDRISFKVEKADRLTVTVVNLDGDRVRRLATGVEARPERPVTVVWDGRSDDGIRAPDGRYRLQVGLRRTGRTVTIPGAFNVDTTAPKPVVVSVKPATAGPVAGAFQIHARRVGSRRAPRFRVLRTDVDPPREVARFLGRKGSQRAEWDGKVNGLPAPPGIYMVVVRVRDKAGNLGTAPAVLPPVPGQVRGKPGITVRALAAQPPVVAVRAGERVAFDVDARDRAYRWDVRRVGGRKVEEGRAAAGKRTLVLRSPRGASGVYLLQVRSGSSRTRVPFLVQSRERSKLLVVVPTASWLGVDKIDDDHDGLPNTLEGGGPVEWPRAYTRLPPALAADTAPLLIFLDRAGIKYDLTSDIALARSDEPTAADHPGVLLAGSLRWIPRSLGRRLRRYVESGGRVASFGTESMRRGMRITDDVLDRPTQPTPTDPFGARLEPVAAPRTEDDGRTPLPLTALTEDTSLGLLTGSDGTLSTFGRLEESAKRPDTPNAKLLTAIGQDVTDSERAKAEAKGELPREALPVLAATRLGKGIEIRVGLTQWAQQANRDREVGQITHNIVDILRRITPKIQ
jgi:FlgD Ig-like domain/N,N-dimethylformamidase beta subunit-like, C-terminal